MVKLQWYVVNKRYIKYLQKYDNLVQNVNYGKNALKPYIGIILEVNNFDYYVPISSFKKKYYNKNEGKDLIKLKAGTKILGIINLNNMIPITYNQVEKLSFKNIENYRSFKNEQEKIKYINLLNYELNIINKRMTEILRKSRALYNEKIDNPDSPLSKRCCNFKLLEQKCLEYEKNTNLITN